MKSFDEMAESVLKRRDVYVIERRKSMKKLITTISCFCLCVILGVGAWQSGIFEKQTSPVENENQQSSDNGGEMVPVEKYVYEIQEGQFSTYVGGKVIVEDKIGDKIMDVALTAGWKKTIDGESQWISQEKLRGEVYSIDGIVNDIAIALKFIDKGEAVTTTHYYVMMNPNADLSKVEDYIIYPIVSDNNGDIVIE